jgi:hypothetical protein
MLEEGGRWEKGKRKKNKDGKGQCAAFMTSDGRRRRRRRRKAQGWSFTFRPAHTHTAGRYTPFWLTNFLKVYIFLFFFGLVRCVSM